MTGDAPAVVALHNYEIPPLARFLYDISDALDPLGIDRANYVDVAWELPVYEGQLLGATMSTGTMALFYNKDLFEQAGLDPEQPPTNTVEFIEAGNAVRSLGEDIWGFARDNGGWMPWYTMNWQHGSGLLNEDGTQVLFNSPAGVEAAALEQSFVQEHAFHPPEPAEFWDLMYAGTLGMVFHGPWNLSLVLQSNEEAGLNIAAAPHVQFFDDAQGIHSTSHIYSVTRQDPEDPVARDAGLTLIAWLLENGSLEWAKAQAPTNLGVLEQMQGSDDPLVSGMALWVEQAAAAKFPPYHAQWGQISTMLVEGMQRIVYQGADPQATLDEVADQSNALLIAA
jgi:multiple sugar transport system substrate-binding protein